MLNVMLVFEDPKLSDIGETAKPLFFGSFGLLYSPKILHEMGAKKVAPSRATARRILDIE
jgi:hypothetical protein